MRPIRGPGITRLRAGRGFSYRDPAGRTIRDPATRARIAALAIPPAWADVWICPWPDGHIQATGRDARGRKQYRYHASWRRRRGRDKFERMVEFGRVLPRLRRRCDRDLRRRGLPREKVLAAVVRLLELTLIRVGNDEYARLNRSFGLTTLQDRHADVRGSQIRFRFRSKAGAVQESGLRDRRLAAIVRRCQDLPGQELFQYVDEDGGVRGVGSDDVNAYLREASGGDFTAKDVRTGRGRS
jgi:DNA topoisomerase I